MLKLNNVTKIYSRGSEHVHAVRDLSLEIAQGDYVGVVGPSGSGKSTLMNMIGLLDAPTAGDVFIADRRVTDLDGRQLNRLRRETIGFIFQQFLLIPTMTALQNVMLPLYFAGAADAKQKAMVLLRRVGLEKRAEHLPSQMSGGEMQRTAIARALANKPRILLADEPTGNLDSKTADDIYSLFSEINREGTTIVMVTHNQDLASTFPRKITMRDGRLEKNEKQ
ncbi:MAG: ABC transporter ATP-binding protein [Deltaproteobacteria bacterium]|jgi:putative ABC transport system ATP-binding protein|nr:ABC transporter ATP-binding protein [Syntrophaceae bacterium]